MADDREGLSAPGSAVDDGGSPVGVAVAEAEEGSLFDRVEHWAEVSPEQVALSGPGGRRSYRDLCRGARRVGGFLLEHLGDGEEAVALLCEHDVDLVVGIMGVLAAGKAVVVLDPIAPGEHQRQILADSGAPILLSDARWRSLADDLAAGRPVAEVAPLAEGDDPGPLDVVVPADRLAMLAYTSGTTTGRPKAARLSHRALAHLMEGATEALGISATDRLPMLFPLSLAVAAYPALLPLVNGARLCTFDLRGQGLNGFTDWLAEEEVTLLYLSPTVARFLSQAGGGTALPAVRMVVLGGERVDAEAVVAVREAFGPGCVVANGYGTTETGVLTFYFTEPGEVFGPHGVPVGRPIPGMDVTLRTEAGDEARPGETGELYVRSRFLFDGYWNRPDLDAHVLVREEGHCATYRTGDLGVRRADGAIELVGRSDDEVKIRGHRVQPAELEQAILARDDIVDAVVEARTDDSGERYLMAFVVPVGPREEFDIPAFRASLSQSVKAHLVPERVMALDALPVLPNGKLDRRALPRPDTWRPLSFSTLVVPRDELEAQLASLWEVILDVAPVGVTDSFFDLGGHSLEAALMLVRVEEDLGRVIPMSDLYEVQTVEQLAARLRASDNRRQPTTVEVQAGSADRPILWFTHDLHGSAYSLRHLAPHLGADQPLWGFESPLLRGSTSAFSRLELLAMRYVLDLREVQPSGPYHLAGYSFGGVLAFEMARQLVAEGHEVDYLAIIDVGPGYRGPHYHKHRPPQRPWMDIPMPPKGQGLKAGVERYRRLARERSWLLNDVLMRSGLDWYLDPLMWWRDVHRTGKVHPGRRLWYAWRKHWELAHDYDFTKVTYPGPLTLLWADETAATDGTMGWRDVVEGDLEIVHLPVDHEVFLQEPGVVDLAAALRSGIDQAVDRRRATRANA